MDPFFLKCTLIDRMATRAGRAAVSALKFGEADGWCAESYFHDTEDVSTVRRLKSRSKVHEDLF